MASAHPAVCPFIHSWAEPPSAVELMSASLPYRLLGRPQLSCPLPSDLPAIGHLRLPIPFEPFTAKCALAIPLHLSHCQLAANHFPSKPALPYRHFSFLCLSHCQLLQTTGPQTLHCCIAHFFTSAVHCSMTPSWAQSELDVSGQSFLPTACCWLACCHATSHTCGAACPRCCLPSPA